VFHSFVTDIHVIRERDKNARLIRIAPQLPTAASAAAHDPFALHLQPDFIPLDTSVTPAAPIHLFPMVLHSSSSSSSSALVSSKPTAPLGFSVLASASDSGTVVRCRQSVIAPQKRIFSSPCIFLKIGNLKFLSCFKKNLKISVLNHSICDALSCFLFSIRPHPVSTDALAEAEAAFYRARRESASSSAEYRMQHSSSSASSSLSALGGKQTAVGFAKHPSRVVASEARIDATSASASAASAAAASKQDGGAEEDGETVDDWTRRRTGEWNVAVRERPSDAALWLRFVAFQVWLLCVRRGR
jgi:hypothetical protein